MSKIFVNENPQQPAPQRQRKEVESPAILVAGVVVLGLSVFVLAMWGKQIAMAAALFVLFGLFARSPTLAIGGALTLLMLAR